MCRYFQSPQARRKCRLSEIAFSKAVLIMAGMAIDQRLFRTGFANLRAASTVGSG
jgi:hypothetical protein